MFPVADPPRAGSEDTGQDSRRSTIRAVPALVVSNPKTTAAPIDFSDDDEIRKEYQPSCFDKFVDYILCRYEP